MNTTMNMTSSVAGLTGWELSQKDVQKMFGEVFGQMEGMRADISVIETNLNKSFADPGERRQMQQHGYEPEPEPEPIDGGFVLQIKRNVTRCGAPGAGNIGGHFDKSRCADHAFQQCNRKECIGYNARNPAL